MNKTGKAKPCPHPDCDRLIDRRSQFCKRHRIITPAMLMAQQKGKERIGWRRVKCTCQNPECGKAFTVPQGEINKGGGKYCNNECRYAHKRGENAPGWKGGLVKVNCFVCGAEKRVKPFKTKRERIFCGHSCNSINNMKNQRKALTDIELIFQDALDKHNINYDAQKAFGKICLADFFLPDYNIVVFCDGVYWHSPPEQQEKDKRQTSKLEHLGYIVYRFTGKEIKADIESCIQSISELTI